MNPLFAAHLFGDFLLQPTWLAKLKQKSVAGVIIHACIHALVLIAVVQPRNYRELIIIGGISVLHGCIDDLKIIAQKKSRSFYALFMADQSAHLNVLLLAYAAGLHIPPYWQTSSGATTLSLLLLCTFGIALANFLKKKTFKLKTKSAAIKQALLVVVTFALFILPGLALGV